MSKRTDAGGDVAEGIRQFIAVPAEVLVELLNDHPVAPGISRELAQAVADKHRIEPAAVNAAAAFALSALADTDGAFIAHVFDELVGEGSLTPEEVEQARKKLLIVSDKAGPSITKMANAASQYSALRSVGPTLSDITASAIVFASPWQVRHQFAAAIVTFKIRLPEGGNQTARMILTQDQVGELLEHIQAMAQELDAIAKKIDGQ